MTNFISDNSIELEQNLDSINYGPANLVVIQPTTFCNLDCNYCYLPDRHLKNNFSLELLEPIFRNLFSSPYLKSEFTIIWHAGEPLTVPPSFYESAFEIINDLSLRFNVNQYPFIHSIQTNGTLINQAWCDLIKKHDIKIGVSLDGPAFLHDAHRQTRKGLGTHASVMRGISFLKKNNINFSVIAVLTQESLKYPDEIFQFFVENQITKVGFNVEEIEGSNQSSSLSESGSEEKYYMFMQRLYELVHHSEKTIEVREFERTKGVILHGNDITVGQFHPFSIINIDHKGNFMTYSPELLSMSSPEYGDFILGNVMNNSFESVCETEKFKKINGDIQAGVDLCRKTCEYFSLCGGGSPGNKYFENGSFRSSETMYCRYTLKILADIVLADIEQSLSF
ncbi:MAG: GRRM system radical SAM/SPASM domain protein [Richelia sp. RM1_1_1]|nr:GRRM system radical SAM/SPASM domain protein [Calothrix sp. SM1_7_51]NJN08156.1 GRRM system radical SAM/SPASM domain protein [Richelia sp. RM1_1_1]